MYFNIGQYPVMRGKSKVQQRLIVLAALRQHDRWINRRFFAVICGLLGIVGVSVHIAPRYLSAQWVDWAILAAGALVFYGYILWEINGPVLRAVERNVAEKN